MSDEPQQPWFFSKDGKQHGPVTMEELRFLATNGQLHPRQDLLWTQGMGEWKPAGEIEGLFEKVVVEVPVAVAPPVDIREEGREESSDELMRHQEEWPGLARGGYFFGSLALIALMIFLPGFIGQYLGGHDGALIGVVVVLWIGCLGLTLGRLSNVGMSKWWVLSLFVPILGWWTGARIFAYPPGYAFTRKIDGVGVFLAIIYWLVLFSPLIIGLLIFFTGLGDEALRNDLRKMWSDSLSALPK